MSTKYTLKDLVDYSLVNNGDQLSFTFKNHVFSASLFKGGLLGHCRWNDTPVFEDRSGFTSLTDWSDTCIQECLNEFVTRFSSWKRVRHVATGTPLHMLRARLWEIKSSGSTCNETNLQTELLSERRKVLYLSQRVNNLERQLRHRNVEQKRNNIKQTSESDNPFRLIF